MTEERRLVTVLFADVSGSTALGEELDPEDLRALLARFFTIGREVVDIHGGIVEKFIGDAVMAIFGLSQAHGDDADRALSAALEIRDRVRADPNLGERLPIRLGVNTGVVVATRDPSDVSAAGDLGALVTGDAVNVAARLQQAAPRWGILAGERTVLAAGNHFAFGPMADVEARGKSSAVRARSLLGRQAGLAQRMPIVGRDADLAQLELVARRAASERRPQLISIIAPAGTGKTRLLEEFLDHLPTLAPDARIAISQCLPYGQRLTYWPLRAVLHRLAGIDEDARPESLRDGVAAWLDDLGAEDPRGLAELLASTIGAGETETADQGVLFAGWRRAIELAAARGPLVLVFEDLHWSSESLLDLVDHVMQPRGELALVMIVLTRPELLDRRPGWGGGRRNYSSLALEPLHDEDVARLVRNLLEGASPDLVEAVVARADGNPFYAGEIVRSVVERLGPGGMAAGSADIEAVLATLPDTVQATVLARLDQLPADERRLLQIGAVFGRSFRPQGIVAVEPSVGARAAPAIDSLLDRDLVRPSGADGYAFRHILIREVAYQTLPRAERARLHAAAGAWMAERAEGREDAYAELVAYHYREAAALGAVGGSEAPAEIRASAVDWLERAADAARATGALVEALHHEQAALALARPEQLPEIYERIAETNSDGGHSVESYEAALRLAREQGRPPGDILRLLAGLLMFHTRWYGAIPTRPSEQGMEALRAEARALLDTGDDRTQARFLISEGFAVFWRNAEVLPVTASHVAAAEQSTRAGLAIAERIEDWNLQSAALDALFSLAVDKGDWRSAQSLSRQRLRFAEHLEMREVGDARAGLAWAACAVGALDEAAKVAHAGLDPLLPGQISAVRMHLASWGTYALGLLGRWDETVAMASRGREAWIEADRPPAGYATPGFYAALEVARARRDDAAIALWRDTIDEILDRFAPNPRFDLVRLLAAGDAGFDSSILESITWAYPERVERVLGFANDVERALPSDVLRSLARTARAHGCLPTLAQALRAQGLATRDEDPLRESLGILESIGARPSAARVRCELGGLIRDGALLADGRRELRLLGDIEQLDRYESLGA